MRRTFLLLGVLAAACSGPGKDRAGCARSADCAAGEVCAATPDGGVCWPDPVAPVVSAVKVTCAAPCLRDGVLRVEATAADDRQLASVHVALDLDPARTVELSPSGQGYAADLRLEEWPFPAFERPVVATVTAVDGAQNAASLEAPADQRPVVTRLRWAQAVDPGVAVALTSPAVRQDGVVVAAGTNGKVFFVAADGTPAREPISMAPAAITVPPAISDDAVWVGTQSGGLFAIDAAGTVSQATCSPGEPIAGAPAAIGTRVVVSSQANVLVVADAAGRCNKSPTVNPSTTGPSVTVTGHVLVPAGGVLNSYSLSTDDVLRASWTGVPPSPVPPSVGDVVSVPVAVDSDLAWSVAQNGLVSRTTAAAATGAIGTVAVGSTGPIILADGSAVIGSSAGLLERVTAVGAPPWSHSAPLNGAPAIPLALRGEGSTPALLTATSTGRLYAVSQDDGQILWETRLSATGQALQPPNIAGTPGARTATAYVGGADGHLYAVIVDGQLDTTAPWPKAFHDPRNTSNAGTLP